MSAAADELIAAMIGRNTLRASADYAPFLDNLLGLLGLGPGEVTDIALYRATLLHAFGYYYASWDKRGAALYQPLFDALVRWGTTETPSLDVLCDIFDFCYFVIWAFEASSTAQCRNAVPVMRAVSGVFARTAAHRSRPRAVPPREPIRVGWLATYARTGDAMSVALQHAAPALCGSGRHELTVYVGRFHDDTFLDTLRTLGTMCHTTRGDTPSARLDLLEAQIAEDQISVLISDTNNALPTALFSRRAAPAQVFVQLGMPAWSVEGLDGVFDGFGFDPQIADWGGAAIAQFNPPWDLNALDPPTDPEELARERASLPQGARLIGCYGRLVKVTEPYLLAMEEILHLCPDAVFVTGGTGDAGQIRAFAERSMVGDRIHVEARFVPGQIWGHVLHVYLDTWPLIGGESCREMIAKGRPVVTLRSPDMLTMIDSQRDPLLIAGDWSEFVALAVRLIDNSAEYNAACGRAKALAWRMSDSTPFAHQFVAGLDRMLAHAGRFVGGR